LEQVLTATLARAGARGCPPRLADALVHAVFPGGNRARPLLSLAVARAYRGSVPRAAYRAAAAVELLHCASLVHDDLPCFDDADLRRGRPTVHRAYGEPTAILVGDALIVLAFEALGRGCVGRPRRLAAMLAVLARAAGPLHGLAGGQAWELEPAPELSQYHAAKTGALFEAALALGALSVAAAPAPWRKLGRLLGLAYQAADDLLDASGEDARLGKPVGQDAAHRRPSAVRQDGVERARARTASLLRQAQDAIPPCPDAGPVRDQIDRFACRLGDLGLWSDASPSALGTGAGS
ncbi:MAG TPA: polyprenyl synthetase family protein, partial [Gemmataceae bacterium]|nr:polyprenyl synthetase family protein [Gemmataceae bacterium]